MSRRRLPFDPNNYLHFTGRTRNRELFPIPIHEVWEIMTELLYFLNKAYHFKIVSFVLMPNHFHLIARADTENLSKGMQHLMCNATRRMHDKTGDINQIWGSRYFRSELNSFHYFMNAYKYVYQNPVRGKLVARAESYPYSTLHGLLGQSHLLVPIEPDELLFEDVENSLEWINVKIEDNDVESMRRALGRKVFKLPKVLGKANRLETDLI
ncbi:MAG: transposase [Bdellovibrionales bacterium]|nr:transposase [Bdellovibrionales bacterium]